MANLLPMLSSINQWLILLVAFYFSGLMLLMLTFDHFYGIETAAAAVATWQKAQRRRQPKDKHPRRNFINEHVSQNAEVETSLKFERDKYPMHLLLHLADEHICVTVGVTHAVKRFAEVGVSHGAVAAHRNHKINHVAHIRTRFLPAVWKQSVNEERSASDKKEIILTSYFFIS